MQAKKGNPTQANKQVPHPKIMQARKQIKHSSESSIILPDYPLSYGILPLKDEQDFRDYNFEFWTKRDKEKVYDYCVFWGQYGYFPNMFKKYGVMETGFFNQAAFIDTVGDYQALSLNSKLGYEAVESFELNGRKSAKTTIEELPQQHRSKYNPEAGETHPHWTGPILALQAPKDRSITRVSTTDKYYEFVEDCCKYYGKSLFLKMHPWNSGEVYEKLAAIATKYGCEHGKTPIKIIDDAEFVIGYNSTFAIDCMLRGVPYAQYEMGTFYNTYGITYTNRTLPKTVTPPESYEKLPNFLIHNYCFHTGMSKKKFSAMIEHYSRSNLIFPMTDEFSYAGHAMSLDHPDFSVGGHNKITHTDKGALEFLKIKFNLKSMLDIGCGPGGQVMLARDIGMTASGLDADPVLQEKDAYIKATPILCDFRTETFSSTDRFDLGWSVEFLEHVEEKHQESYMKAFQLCDRLCVTAFGKGNTNKHHHNCKPKEYWVSVFEKYGFEYDEETTNQVKRASTMNRPFLRDTGMIFKRKGL